MEETAKARQEMMTRILGWGMIVYFFVLGYSLNQHALFELTPSKEQETVVNAKKSRAGELRNESSRLRASNAVEASNIDVKAAEADLEARTLSDDMRDGRSRATGLITGAAVFFIFYSLLIAMYYRKFESEMAGFFISRNIALAYSVFIGGSILVTAIFIAVF